ncbi:MAG: hypothetical protein M1827_003829 [Pycnora praestabilis]|nr:MAG: hypothetical protein M1827_003829 [Pycnora praestabilis]
MLPKDTLQRGAPQWKHVCLSCAVQLKRGISTSKQVPLSRSAYDRKDGLWASQIKNERLDPIIRTFASRLNWRGLRPEADRPRLKPPTPNSVKQRKKRNIEHKQRLQIYKDVSDNGAGGGFRQGSEGLPDIRSEGKESLGRDNNDATHGKTPESRGHRSRHDDGSVSNLDKSLITWVNRVRPRLRPTAWGKRGIHTSPPILQAFAETQQHSSYKSLHGGLASSLKSSRKSDIRERLQVWQDQYADEVSQTLDALGIEQIVGTHTTPNDPLESHQIVEQNDNRPENDIYSTTELEKGQLVDFDSNRPFLSRGDLVEIGGAGREPTLGVFIRDFDYQSQFYTMRGQWVHINSKNIAFSVPRFFPREMVEPILPYLPSGEVSEHLEELPQDFELSVPRGIGKNLILGMSRWWNAAEEIFRKKSTYLDNAHDILAHETELRQASLEDIAPKLLHRSKAVAETRLTSATLYAVHRALTRNEVGFVSHQRNHRISYSFYILSKQDLRLFDTVKRWVREFQEHNISSASQRKGDMKSHLSDNESPFLRFISKAQRLIRQSRSMRGVSSTGVLGPSTVKLESQEVLSNIIPSETFNDNDNTVIQFLEAWVLKRNFPPFGSIQSIGPMVLRATGMYSDHQLSFPTGFAFLQEIGVIAPWENRLVFNPVLELPGHGNQRLGSRRTKEKVTAMKEEATAISESAQNLTDSMADLRQDWKDLEAYCIDAASAKDIDDGISLENIAESPSVYWMHIHVANPSAFLRHDSAISEYAAKQVATLYFPERSYSMLPVTNAHSQFSLAPDRPVLTFSAKINEHGDILESRVTPSVIRKVTYITPSALRDALGVESTAQIATSSTTTIKVGGDMPPEQGRNLRTALSGTQKQELTVLRNLGNAYRHKRLRNRGLGDLWPNHEISVSASPYSASRTPIPIRRPSRVRAFYHKGDPVIQYRAKPFDPTATNIASTDFDPVVASAMIIAGEVAANWCEQRNIPVIYRGSIHDPDKPDPAVFWQNNIFPFLGAGGSAPISTVLKYLRMIGKTAVMTTPMHHAPLGVERYTKATSPLRRYGDLLLHWQIEAALRQEAKTGKSLVGSLDDSYLPFPKARLDAMLPQLTMKERLITNTQGSAERHWFLQLMARAFYFKETRLPETFEVYIYAKGTYTASWSAYMKDPAYGVEMLNSDLTKQHGGVNIGDWWEAKINNISTYHRNMQMEPVRLISRVEAGL